MPTFEIPIFDTLSHPTLNGNWILPKYTACAHIENIINEMHAYGIKKSLAVGMNGIGGYDEDKYIDFINRYGKDLFLPIAFFDFQTLDFSGIKNRLIEVKEKGYCGIKLHPRFANFILSDERLPYIVDVANELDLIPLLCTFFYCNHQSMLDNNIERIGDLLMKCSNDSDIVLLHGGLTRVLETMELVRFFPNVLLDLSLTMCKYEGSHIDNDIRYIFKLFDRRTTIGADSPEISYQALRRRFEYFASYTTVEKAENIAYKNIESIFIKHNLLC